MLTHITLDWLYVFSGECLVHTANHSPLTTHHFLIQQSMNSGCGGGGQKMAHAVQQQIAPGNDPANGRASGQHWIAAAA